MRQPDFTLTAGPTIASHRVLLVAVAALADLGVSVHVGGGAQATTSALSEGPR